MTIDTIGLLTEQYRLLGHEGLGFTEIRVINRQDKSVRSYFVKGEDEFVRTAAAFAKSDVYVGVNPRRKESGKSEDVSHVTAIVFDFDPIRPKDDPSTEAQHEEAIALAQDFSDSVGGFLSSSGSGAHVYFPIHPIPVGEGKDVADSLANFAHEVQEKYKAISKTVRIDSTFDLPRVIRCWGSWNTKSSRFCEPLGGSAIRHEFKINDYRTKEVSVVAKEAPGASSLSERFKKIAETSFHIKRIVEKKVTYPSRSEADFAFGSHLFRAGFNPQEVLQLMPLNPLGKCAEKGARHTESEVRRIYDKVKDTVQYAVAKSDEDEYTKGLMNRTMGILTGFDRWDSMTSGLKVGRFYVDAGRPGEGKTTRLVQIAVHVAEAGHRVMYFPTECTKSVIYDKMVSLETRINSRKFNNSSFSTQDKEILPQAIKKIMGLPICVVENHALKFKDIEKAVHSWSPEYIIIDFLNNMSYNDVNSASELGANVIAIKNLGKKYNIPVTLACQLHRKLPGTEYSLSDLKGTGKLEEEGDIITFVHSVNIKTYPVNAKVIVLKNKFGETAEIKNDFFRAESRFEEVREWTGK